ncbi:pyridoxamine 5'-phosphate oxidase family protein [Kibdelosporangium aridum]|uniref:Pyridoxamine 5'-phosphate oxidase n=1 Tax=Kibdelosporangium aridum TaxID=2030 RepID=A0A1Y5Y875_KIBAR|nr:pyridoxamine 5'-phosphate oxidase family protein [Kibdelosporangium aridum]SMD25889.1 Pyridoxamine 5'-phosphate oxidase [Kibdelosporangium aridum]
MSNLTKQEREQFLADVHVGVLTVADVDGRGPLAVPLGYLYEPGGEIRFATAKDCRKMTLVRAAGRVGFLVQKEQLPYRYVSVEGPVVGEHQTTPDEHLTMSIRYFGPQEGRSYFEMSKHALSGMVTVRVLPQRWRTYDSSDELP